MMQSKFIVAEEDDSVKIRGDDIIPRNGHDVIPGPPASMMTRIVSRADLSESATFRLSQSNNMKKGKGMLASPDDLKMSPEIFAQGCMLLQQAALGNQEAMEKILAKFPDLVNFRDYDRRTALHVASSEGNLDIFGQKPEFTFLTPLAYQWSRQNDPRDDWDQFKLLIDEDLQTHRRI